MQLRIVITSIVVACARFTNGAGAHDFRRSDWLACPKPPYPPVALQKHVEGAVEVAITVDQGRITSVTPKSGPEILSSGVARWITSYWKPKQDSSGLTVVRVQFGAK